MIGMVGLDLYHGDHHTELHPVYAMFLKLKRLATNRGPLGFLREKLGE